MLVSIARFHLCCECSYHVILLWTLVASYYEVQSMVTQQHVRIQRVVWPHCSKHVAHVSEKGTHLTQTYVCNKVQHVCAYYSFDSGALIHLLGWGASGPALLGAQLFFYHA